MDNNSKHEQINFVFSNDGKVEFEPSTEHENIDSVITEPFDPSEIDIKEKTMTIDLLVKRMKNCEINFNTGFQRSSGLWTLEQQSRLIESLMIRIPLPAFYFDGSDDNNWLVVDGLQRLSTLDSFILKEELELKNLEYLSQFNGARYRDLPRQMQRRIEEAQIIAFVINPGTPGGVKFNIFKRINTGGLVLNPQEIRHALHQGIPADVLAKLAKDPEFLIATCNSIKTDRMEDRDFILRFIAFSITHYLNYTPDLDSFLNNSMEKLGKLSEIQRSELARKFQHAMITAYSVFGGDAFRKRFHSRENRKPINKALFETFAVTFGNLTEAETDLLINNRDLLKRNFISLMQDEEFVSSITHGTGDVRRVHYRFHKVEALIKGVLE